MQNFFKFFTVFFLLIFTHSVSAVEDNSADFVSLSDLHFNPYDSCSNTSPCALVDELRTTPVAAWEGILAKHQTSPNTYGADANYPLLKQALHAAAKTVSNKTRFVVVSGDLISHNYNKLFSQYSSDKSDAAFQSFVKKTIEFVTDELDQAFPHQDVFVALGNNDAYAGDNSYDGTHQFYQDSALIFGQLIRDEATRKTMQQQFAEAGYYAVDVPHQPDLHLIVLNTILFSKKGFGEGIDQAAKAEMAWFDKELQQNNKKTLILMHIPPGIDVFSSVKLSPFTVVELWKPGYTQQFLAELQQHSAQIVGLLAGHFHMDSFEVLVKDAIPLVITPGISPLFGNNPSFKVMTYSTTSLNLQDFVTYFDKLNDSSGWELEYSFNKVYQSDCNDCLLVNGMNQLQKVGVLANQFQAYFAAGADAQPITKDQKWLPYYWCAIHHITKEDYLNCVTTQ